MTKKNTNKMVRDSNTAMCQENRCTRTKHEEIRPTLKASKENFCDRLPVELAELQRKINQISYDFERLADYLFGSEKAIDTEDPPTAEDAPWISTIWHRIDYLNVSVARLQNVQIRLLEFYDS